MKTGLFQGRDIAGIHKSIAFSSREPDVTLAFAGPRLEVEDLAAAGVAATLETEATAEDRRMLKTVPVHRGSSEDR